MNESHSLHSVSGFSEAFPATADSRAAAGTDADSALFQLQHRTARRADELAREPGRRVNDLAVWLEAEIEVLAEYCSSSR